ncbi:hypothetical protein N9P41_01205 [Pseudomonadales bacterium]|nr:hypothetical protein [Pseudomonadales bacterium]
MSSLIGASCGGGGGGSSPTPTPVQVANRAPVLADPGTLTVLEGATSIATISASDPDNNSLAFTISSGDDQALFSITSSGLLSFSVAPDFESPGDVGSDNVYELTVQVSDGTLTDTQSISVTVSDAFEGRVVDAPISGASVFVDLNGNNEQDEGEPSGTTDANGFFSVDTFTPTAGTAAKVMSKGGTDTKTGKVLSDLALISDLPADLTKLVYLTPLITVVASVDTPEAKAAVLTGMGITGSPEDLLTNDGWAAAEAGDENARANQRLNQQIGLLFLTAATIVDDGNPDTDVSVQLAKAVATQISTAAVSDEGVDLTSSNTLNAVLVSVIAEVVPDAVITTDAISAIASSLAAVNMVFSNPNLDPLSDVALDIVRAAQEGLQASVAELASGDVSVTDFETATDLTNLFKNIVVAADALDTDDDGIPNVLDTDDDGDGVPDGKDIFPLDKNESLDTDSDGTGNNADSDDDGDGIADTADAFPLDKSETLDTDADGIGNNADTDDDGDGLLDTVDGFPLAALGDRADTDGDGRPNECDSACLLAGMTADTDDDNDRVPDLFDAFTENASEYKDFDGDGIGDNADLDDDNDGLPDATDKYPLDAFPKNSEYAVFQRVDVDALPEKFLNIVPVDKPDFGVSVAESGAQWVLGADGVYKVETAVESSHYSGTWSLLDGRIVTSRVLFSGPIVRSSYVPIPLLLTPTQSPFVDETSINANELLPPAKWSNIDLLYWNANYAKDICYWGSSPDGGGICLTQNESNATAAGGVEVDPFESDEVFLEVRKTSSSKLELLERNGSQWVFLQTTVEETRLNKSEYLLDPSLPVEVTTATRVVYLDDGSSVQAFTAEELVGDWVLPIQADFTQLNDADGDGEQDDVVPAALSSDSVSFKADFSGTTLSGGRSFEWSVGESGSLAIKFVDDSYLVTVKKYLSFSDSIGVHVEVEKQDRVLSEFTLAFKKSDEPISLEMIAGKGLLWGESQPYRSNPALAYDPSATPGQPNNPQYSALKIPGDEKSVALAFSQFTDVYDPNFQFMTGESAFSPNPNQQFSEGWLYREYAWSYSENTARLTACYFYGGEPLEDAICNFAVHREIEFFRASETKLYYFQSIYTGFTGDKKLAEVTAETESLNLLIANSGFYELDFDTSDLDGDGIVNAVDLFPFDPTQSKDTDGDGVADNVDAFSADKNETLDTDGDGIGNNADPDDDGDGINDKFDAFPLDKNEFVDSDGDGIGDFADFDDNGDGFGDLDTDLDGTGDSVDALPNDRKEIADTDQDGIGNNSDADDDADGVADTDDAFPLDASESIDTDLDGIGNNADLDDDGDGYNDLAEILQNSNPEDVSEFPGSGGYIYAGAGYVYGDASTGLATLPVRRLFAENGEVSIDYATLAGSKTLEGSDFTAVSGTLTWEDGDDSDKYIEVPLQYAYRGSESTKALSIQLSNPSGGAILAASRSQIYFKRIHQFAEGDEVLTNFPGIVRPLAGNSIFEEASDTQEIRFGRFRSSVDFTEDFTVGYQITGCEAQWALTEAAKAANSSDATSTTTIANGVDGSSEEHEEQTVTPHLMPRSGTLTWAAGDDTPKAVKLKIDPDSLVSNLGTTCSGFIYLIDPSHPDAWLDQQNSGISYTYLDDELPESGRILASSTFFEEGDEVAELSLIRRGNTQNEISTVVWADPYPSPRWAGIGQGLAYRQGPPESWTSGVAGKDYVDTGKQILTWGPGEVQAKSVQLELIDNEVDDLDQLIYWNFIHTNDLNSQTVSPYVYTSDTGDRSWTTLDSDSDQIPNGLDFDIDGDGLYNWLDYDRDGDGVGDYQDAFRWDPSRSYDLDFDGIADEDDTDRDGDGIANDIDSFPNINKDLDYDGDGATNFLDSDDDNDLVLDFFDAFPLDETESSDTDGDGIGENSDDNDGDGIFNAFDAYPSISIGALTDLDGDGAPGICDAVCLENGMLVDPDDDADGWPDDLEILYGSDPTSVVSGLTFIQRGNDIDGESAGDLSGIVSINADGTVVAIGAVGSNSGAGQVRVFEFLGGAILHRRHNLDHFSPSTDIHTRRRY